MFKVRHKESGNVSEVYHIRSIEGFCGVYFLVYFDGEFREIESKYFEPYNDIMKGATKKKLYEGGNKKCLL